jgi:ribosomal protein L14E/L6E/L27E
MTDLLKPMDLQSDLQPGQIVISKAGRDKGEIFVVIATEVTPQGEFALLVDGAARPLSRPKRKKRKHIQHTLTINEELAKAIPAGRFANGPHLKDSDFKKAIKTYKKSNARKGQFKFSLSSDF